MQATVEMINLDNIDKSEWELFPFEKIAHRISETVDPNTTSLEVYVGLEHIDAEDIHIRRFGNPSDVNGGKLKCYPGDVIFGKRRAYQRKAAIVEFEGICSAHAFVFRANSDIIDPKLFPFFLHSDQFMHRMVDISVGGLSPTINWGNLKGEEFLLPPKSEQARLAELLWAMDEVIEKEKRVFQSLDNLFKTKVKYISNYKKHELESKKIKDVCIIKDNQRRPLNSNQRSSMKGDIPYYGANGLVDWVNDYIFDEELVLVAEDGGDFHEFYKKEIAYKIKGKSWVNNHAHVLTVKDELFPIDWLYFSLVHKNIIKYIIGTTRLKLNKSELEKVKIWVPSKRKIDCLLNELTTIFKSRSFSNKQIKGSQSLQKSLINQIF